MHEESRHVAPVAERTVSRSTRWVLISLRVYVFAMIALFLYKFILTLTSH